MGTAAAADIAIRDEDLKDLKDAPPTTLSATPGLAPDVATIIESRRQERQRANAAEDAAEQAAKDIAAQLEQGVTLNGRRWFPVRRPTYQQQHIRMGIVERAGVLPLVERYQPDVDDADVLAASVIKTAFANGALFDLLAALLVEEGKPWSAGAVVENALAFATLVELDDMATLNDIVLWLVLDFFTQLGPLLGTFLRSSRAGRDPSSRATERTASRPRAPASSRQPGESGSAATLISASGTGS